ncbi:MAG: FecR family protein [Bacteroidales bacterium]|nr:FecR family protein [Bacteroidales bacterium]
MKHDFFKTITLESLIDYIENPEKDHSSRIVENWLNADPENLNFFLKIKEAWLNRADLNDLRRENIDKDFDNVLRQIQALQTAKSGKTSASAKSFSMRLLRWAASVIIIMASAGIAYFIGRAQGSAPVKADVVYNEMIVPIGQRSQIVLSDGTTVWVNAGSKFRFPSQFSDRKREVWLDGEGLFNVAKDTSKTFYVHTSDLDVKVHGTVFNLKAYSSEDIIETTVVEGIVSFEMTESKAEKSKDIFLEPNHKAIYLKKESAIITEELKREVKEPLKPLKIIISEPVKVEPVISWTEGKLIFTDESLGNILQKLERKYDVQIIVNNGAINHLKYTGVLKHVSIEQALRALQMTTGIQYTIKDNIITISEKKEKI